MLRLDEDHHVHSTFSDGKGTVLELAAIAASRGLTELGFADHVRRDSDWLDGFVDAVRRAQVRMPAVRLRVGVEAKMLDAEGTLDLPPLPAGVEQVVIADHQFPGQSRPLHPRLLREAVEGGWLTPDAVVRQLVSATRKAVLACPREPIVGHLFSILPKIGIPHAAIDPELVDPLFEACLTRGARLEVDERWRSPGVRVVSRALAAGVHVVASSDSHTTLAVGRYRYVRQVAESVLCSA